MANHAVKLFRGEYRCWLCSVLGDLAWALEHVAHHQYTVTVQPDGTERNVWHRPHASGRMTFEGYVRAVAEGRFKAPIGSFTNNADRAWWERGAMYPIVRIRRGQLSMDDKVAQSYRQSYNVYMRQLTRDRHDSD